jgi:hypothetical protein
VFIQIRQQIQLKGNLSAFREPYRDFESEIVPHKGDFIYDSAFKDPSEYEVIQTFIDLESQTCFVHLVPYVIDWPQATENDVIRHVEMMMLHNWKCVLLDR